MSTSNLPVAALSAVTCGNCGHTNALEAKFCGGCGHAIFEPCGECQASVRLTQKFCGDCGADLDAMLERRMAESAQSMAAALAAVKEHRYDVAVDRLKTLTKLTDYRFAEFVNQAKQALPKVTMLKEQVLRKVEDAQAKALAAFKAEEHGTVIDLLSSLPAMLLSPEATAALAKAIAKEKEVTELNDGLRDAISTRDYCAAGSLLERAIELFPDDPAFRKLAQKVSSKLMSAAESLFERCDYDAALDRLDSIPTSCQNEDYGAIKDRIATVDWLTHQFAAEPFATPSLGKLAIRLSKEVPNDPRGRELTNKIGATLKEPRRDPFVVYPSWGAKRESAIGGDVAIFGWPQSIDFSGQATIQQQPGRFGVAFGLALQSLGVANFTPGFTQKKKLIEQLSKKRATSTGWGIDIGTSAVKAVQLRRDGDKLVVANAYTAEYPEVVRPGRDNSAMLAMRETLKEMVTQLELQNADCWVNYPSRDILVRFIDLPPVDNKKAMKLLEAEVEGQFPVNTDELEILKWVADNPEREGYGRPSVLIAARKFLINLRWSFLSELGLKPSGMQCESIALMNLIWRECAEQLEIKDDKSTTVPAIAIVDAGATSTTFCVVAAKRFWFRTIDGGGEEATMALSRSAKVVREVAERMKRVPHEIPLPATQYHPVEEKQEASRHRMVQLIDELTRNNRELVIDKTLVTGGACFGFGWIRRAICKPTRVEL